MLVENSKRSYRCSFLYGILSYLNRYSRTSVTDLFAQLRNENLSDPEPSILNWRLFLTIFVYFFFEIRFFWSIYYIIRYTFLYTFCTYNVWKHSRVLESISVSGNSRSEVSSPRQMDIVMFPPIIVYLLTLLFLKILAALFSVVWDRSKRRQIHLKNWHKT